MTGAPGVVRPVRLEDAAAVARIYAEQVATSAATFEEVPPDAAEHGRRIAAVHERFPWLVLARGAAILGYAYAGPHRTRPAYRWTVETSVYVDAAARGQRVGDTLYAALFPILVRQGFRTALAGIVPGNPASVALHVRHGFRHVGTLPAVGFKLDGWHDVTWWARELAPASTPPREPRPFCALDAAASTAPDGEETR